MSLVPYVHLVAPLAGLPVGASVPLGDDDRHHLTRVLRLRAGADLVVADGAGSEAPAILGDTDVRLAADPRTAPSPRPQLVVAQALAKGRKVDEVVRQVTELGVDAIVPVAAARSVVRLEGERAAKAVERWRAVVRATAEQARRPWRAEVEPIVAPGELARRAIDGDHTLVVAVPGAPPLPRILAELTSTPGVLTVAIGPEGGWSETELELLDGAGARRVGLGPTVLRSEHAAAAALSVVAAQLGRWD